MQIQSPKIGVNLLRTLETQHPSLPKPSALPVEVMRAKLSGRGGELLKLSESLAFSDSEMLRYPLILNEHYYNNYSQNNFSIKVIRYEENTQNNLL